MPPPTFPTHTIILITAAMVQGRSCAWLILPSTRSRLPPAVHTKRNWRWGVGVFLAGWFVVRFAMQIAPPGGVLGAKATVAFCVFGIVAGMLPLWISPTFRQII